MNRSSRQKINKETVTLNDTLNQMELIDIYRVMDRSSRQKINKEIVTLNDTLDLMDLI